MVTSVERISEHSLKKVQRSVTLASERGSERYSTVREAVKYLVFGSALLVIVGIIASPLISGVEANFSGLTMAA